ncbi:hypothetical protein AA313_de0207240 [Arthrobotrys entomopaga]|nr:hypothetical protein AA313_de0207240 [Arthrobotrys entomopaga]
MMATGLGGGFSLSSLLDQYEPSAPTGVTNSSTGRGSDIRRNGDTGRDGASSGQKKDRPAPIGVPGRSLKGHDTKSGTSSPLNTFTPPISKALDATTTQDAAEKKRKLEENGTDGPKKKSRFEGMTKEQKIAEVKRLKALKAAKEAAKLTAPGKDGNGSGSAASNPNSPITAEAPRKPAKGSYAEIMERAKQLQATSAAPAKIIHKETKVERKKLATKAEKPELGKKSAIGAPKAQNGRSNTSLASSRQSPAKKSVGRPTGKKPEPPKPEPKRPRVPQVVWSGTARPSTNAPPPPDKSSSRPSERDRDRSRDRDRDRERSWERERERERDRHRYRSPVGRSRSPVKRYRYADEDEDDYDSESDMEAGGLDLLDEEDYSGQIGRREDLEAEKLERELAARKAKKLGRRF